MENVSHQQQVTEAWTLVVFWLDAVEVLGSSLVCRSFNTIANSPLLWRELCKRDFKITDGGSDDGLEWKQIYKRRRLYSKKTLEQQILWLENSDENNPQWGTSKLPLSALPLGNSCPFAYFEVYFLCSDHFQSSQSLVFPDWMVGVVPPDTPRYRPGYYPGSYALHSLGRLVDGQYHYFGHPWKELPQTFHHEPEKGKSWYVVGCGIHLEERQLFFTVNGQFLGIAASDLPHPHHYHLCFFTSVKRMWWLNFGQEPFLFDLSSLLGQSSQGAAICFEPEPNDEIAPKYNWDIMQRQLQIPDNISVKLEEDEEQLIEDAQFLDCCKGILRNYEAPRLVLPDQLGTLPPKEILFLTSKAINNAFLNMYWDGPAWTEIKPLRAWQTQLRWRNELEALERASPTSEEVKTILRRYHSSLSLEEEEQGTNIDDYIRQTKVLLMWSIASRDQMTASRDLAILEREDFSKQEIKRVLKSWIDDQIREQLDPQLLKEWIRTCDPRLVLMVRDKLTSLDERCSNSLDRLAIIMASLDSKQKGIGQFVGKVQDRLVGLIRRRKGTRRASSSLVVGLAYLATPLVATLVQSLLDLEWSEPEKRVGRKKCCFVAE